MSIRILQILAEFQGHLRANLGKPIGLATIGAFSKMVSELLAVLSEGKE